MSLFQIVAALLTLAAVATYLKYRFLKMPTAIGLMLSRCHLLASTARVATGKKKPG